MPKQVLRIATRNSPLALVQAEHVKSLLEAANPTSDLEICLKPMSTTGDRWLEKSLNAVGGKGLFVKELEEALLSNQADIAVHSMKDMPAELPPGLIMGAILKRESSADVLISPQSHDLNSLPIGSKLGTASLRRQAQALHFRPDLQVELLRGNINTRLEKLKAGLYDAIILAQAGITRLGFKTPEMPPIQNLSPLFLPAIGQGALGVECREQDPSILDVLKPLHDPLTAICIETERLLGKKLNAGCHAPIAAHAVLDSNGLIFLKALVAKPNGSLLIQAQSHEFRTAEESASEVSADLIQQGAFELLGNAF
ncbi:MAG: hydroxymethylbilane synthase [Gammaproteobacteria bacterium]